ncbi:hypothetical protein EDC96DRAFT_27469 [Choanephora cucurbitarum]|nr:hypothetical protein EDC96DRAFT_27469 [Choanephora cucurbitarum]
MAGHHVRRDAFHGPRNPYGPLSFLTLTVHGIVTVHFQQSATRFSQFTTSLPTTQRRKMREAGCYSMTLAGLDSWERISHASVLLKDNHIYLATYNQTSVIVYTLDVQFPKRQDQGRIACRVLSSMEPRPREGYHLTQLVLLPSLSLVIGMGSHASHSNLAFWTCQTQQTNVTSALGTVEHQETTFVHQSTLEIQDRFISVIKATQAGQLVVGLSDGSIYQQQSNDLDQLLTTPALVQPSEDPVVDLVLSPNQTHLIYQLNSMKLGVVRIPVSLTNEQLEQQFQLCLLNKHDYLDLVAHLIHTRSEDQVDTLVHHVLLNYQQHIPFDLAEWSLAQRGKPYGLAMAVYKRIPNRQIQFTHFSRAIQLPLILECFVSSLSDTDKPEFDVHSLWSLVSLSSWIYDYLQWILREWYLLFHRVPLQLKSKQVHAILLVHPESRSCLVKILKCIQQFIQFSQTSNLIPVDTKSLLQRYTTALVHHEAIVLSETIEFLQALDTISLNEGK